MDSLKKDIRAVAKIIPIAVAICFTIIYLIFSGVMTLLEDNHFYAFIKGAVAILVYLLIISILLFLTKNNNNNQQDVKLKNLLKALDSITIIFIALMFLSKYVPTSKWIKANTTHTSFDDVLPFTIVGMFIASFIHTTWLIVKRFL